MLRTRLLLLYGSQTGTAQDVAERLARYAKRHRFCVQVKSMEEYSVVDLIKEQLVLFVCSTTGQGDEPDNMKSFWMFLRRRSLPSNSLVSMKYGLIGLGDSSYLKFNFVAKRLHKRLQQLGAEPLLEPVYADDQHELGPDTMIDEWLETFWSLLSSLYPLPPNVEVISEDVLEPSKYNIRFCNGSSTSSAKEAVFGFEDKSHMCPVLLNERVTASSHFQDVRLLKFDITGCNIQFDPGDVAMIQPQNTDDDVQQLCDLLGLSPEKVFEVESPNEEENIPSFLTYAVSVKQCAKCYWNLSYVPKRSFFELFWHFSKDDLERERLREFSSTSGQEDLVDYVIRPKRTILEVFSDFPRTTPHVPLKYLFDLIPPILPRAFSIANSLNVFPNQLHVLAAIVSYRTILKKPRKGLCTSWFTTLPVAAKVPLTVRKGTFRFCPDTVPVVMVGPGTGCAPFRGFIQDRCSRSIGNNYLFFGSRNKSGDFFFNEEWEKIFKQGLLYLKTAFSRDQDHKVYVQHRILEEKHLVWNLILEGAWLYIAGNAKDMVPNVRSAFLKVIQDCGSLSEADSEQYLKNLEGKRCFQVEAWS